MKTMRASKAMKIMPLTKLFRRPSAHLSAPSRHRIRSSGSESACIRRTGPKTKDFARLGESGKRHRARLEAKVKRIVIGAGWGRSGTTSLAVNFQKQGGWRVTHEAGNTQSIDFCMAMKDSFSLRAMTSDRRVNHASKLKAAIALESCGAEVAGDISHVHSQIIEELLQTDDRVVVVFMHRKSDMPGWVDSVMRHHPQGGRVENFLLQGWGITAEE